jgi:hypothetical protein
LVLNSPPFHCLFVLLFCNQILRLPKEDSHPKVEPGFIMTLTDRFLAPKDLLPCQTLVKLKHLFLYLYLDSATANHRQDSN